MIPITRPVLGLDEKRLVAEVIDSGWLTQGPRVAEFEKRFAEVCGCRFAVACSNCTTALHMALVALDIGPGDEVIVPSMSFIATANAVVHAGATPIFAEVDPRTYNLDPDAAAAMISPRTRAIMPVHQIGMPADMDRFRALADRYGLAIVEDAACAIGSKRRGKQIGTDGVMACWSFHPRKVICTGEGGMVTTDHEELASRLRLLRQHGMSVPDTARHGSQKLVIENYLEVGWNYRMTDLQAAVGLAQLAKLPELVAQRRRLAAVYSARLQEHPWLIPPFVPEDVEPNFQSYALQVRPGCPLTRNQILERLLAAGIACKPGIMTAHREPAYRERGVQIHLPITEQAADSSLLIPLYPGLTDAEQEYIVQTLFAIFAPIGVPT